MSACEGKIWDLFAKIGIQPDMEFVQNFTPPDFQVKNFTPPISPNFNSFSKKKHKKLVKMEKFTSLATNFPLPPALTGWTNSTSVLGALLFRCVYYVESVFHLLNVVQSQTFTYLSHCHINRQQEFLKVQVVVPIQVKDAENMTGYQGCVS